MDPEITNTRFPWFGNHLLKDIKAAKQLWIGASTHVTPHNKGQNKYKEQKCFQRKGTQ